jgi:MFS family permease
MIIKSKKSSPGTLTTALRAFRHRNYRLFFFGQGVSLIGTWMQSVATSWLVYRLTESPMALGLVAFAGQAPAFFVSPLAGVMNDRWDRRRILVIVQFIAMAQAFTLAYISFTGLAGLWNLLALSLVLGLINAFEMPTRQALVIELIDDKADIGNAIALNSTLFNGTRLIGPALAGIIVAYFGESICFVVNGVTYISAIFAFSAMRIEFTRSASATRNVLAELREGIRYAVGFPPIRDILILISLISLVGMSFPVILPEITAKVLGGGSGVFGALVASSGLGATVGTVYLALRKNVLGLSRVIRNCMFVFAAGLIGFSFSPWQYLSMALIAVVGFGMIVNIAASNIILQTIVDEDKRGRVMSFYIMAFMGTAPLGSLLAGSLSSALGAPAAVLIGGLICLVGAIVFSFRVPFLRGHIRPVYRRMGIIPEVAAGIEAAAEMRKPAGFSGN